MPHPQMLSWDSTAHQPGSQPPHPYQPVLPAQAVEGRLLITSSQCLNEQPRSWWPVAQGPLLSCVASPYPSLRLLICKMGTSRGPLHLKL